MSAESDNVSAFGIRSRIGWPLGGALAGAIGAVAFGIVMWLFDPAIVRAAIPAIYGLDPVGIAGWGIHIAHGAVLGVLFGFLITRDFVFDILQEETETGALSRTGVFLRVVAAGFAFGLAVWAILPVIVLPVWAGILGTDTAAAEFPTIAVASMVGHVVFGTITGLVFGATIDVTDRSADDTPAE